MMTKKPANRHALPKVIISEVDNKNILEFKIKYEKLARLDRVEVKAMHYDEKCIVFDEVVVNGGLIEVEYKDEGKTLFVQVSEKSYSIRGQKVGGKQRLREERVSQIKVQLELSDGSSERVSRTERELIVADNIKLYSQIVGREVKTTKEIYLAKRFLGYRSDLLFYYGFVDNFFRESKNLKYGKQPVELWEDKFQVNDKLTAYTKFMFNDDLQNSESYLKEYVKDNHKIKNDLESARDIFATFRHNLMHFNYSFFTRLFNGEDVKIKNLQTKKFESLSDVLRNVEFLNKVIQSIDKLNIDTRKEFIDKEKITLFNEELDLQQLYGFFAYTAINRVAFNKLINSFIIKDGIENEQLKEYFNQRVDGTAYEIDIHQNREYKELYKKHKNLVSKVSTLSDGKEIARGNTEISVLKEQMNKITKANSLKRLEHKLRLAFGFIYTEYGSYKAFVSRFNEDTKRKKIKNVEFEKIGVEKQKEYYESTFTSNNKDKLGELIQEYEKLSLNDLIENDTFLKVILLLFIFMPKEVKGDFLGFIKKYYHDTKHIEEDTKEKDEGFTNTLPIGLKLKIVERNIAKLSVLKHSLSLKVKYNRGQYEEDNTYRKVFKKLNISHNQEEFHKSMFSPLLRYYASLYKLINDFEIYTLSHYITDKYSTLNKVIASEQFHYRYGWNREEKKGELVKTDNYTFSTLLSKKYGHKNSQEISEMRNKISHFDEKILFKFPLEEVSSVPKGKGKYKKDEPIKSLKEKREEIVSLMEKQTDMQKVLGYDAINDFRMKTVQFQTKLKVYSNKEETIKKMIVEAKTPNDFYNIYKVKGVEGINEHLLNVIGETEAEKSIKKLIAEGNRTNS